MTNILTIHILIGYMVVTCPTQPNHSYQCECSTDMATWQAMGPAVQTDKPTTDFVDYWPTNCCKFYRVSDRKL